MRVGTSFQAGKHLNALELKNNILGSKISTEKKNEAIILMGSVERCCLWNSHEPATASIVYSVVPVKEE